MKVKAKESKANVTAAEGDRQSRNMAKKVVRNTKRQSPMTLKIFPSCEYPFDLVLLEDCSVAQLKQEIREVAKLPDSVLQLQSNGVKFNEDGKAVSEYGMKDGSRIAACFE